MEVIKDLFGFAAISKAKQNYKAAIEFGISNAALLRDTNKEIIEIYKLSPHDAIEYCRNLDPILQDAIICGKLLSKNNFKKIS
jgi:hypothetical protein